MARRLHDFGEDATGRRRMQEGDARPTDAGPRLLVDEAHPGVAKTRENSLEIGYLVCDMVQTRAPRGQELPDRGVGPQRGEELDVILSHVEQNGLHPLLLDHLAVHQLHGEGGLVQLQGVLEALNRNADVVDTSEDARQCNDESRLCGPPLPSRGAQRIMGPHDSGGVGET